MKRRTLLSWLATAPVALAVVGAAHAATPDPGYRLSGPYVHENLAIYLIHRKSTAGRPAPLTLQEALASGAVRLRETGRVNRLEIENLGDKPVFLQAGDIVKGGKQDRVVTASLILPPKSGTVALDAFCVEKGRWSKRSGEAVHRFSSSTARMPSKAGKLALYADARPARPGLERDAEVHANQRKVWSTVDTLQKRLSTTIGATVNSGKSKTSLQLALENKRLAAALAGYQAAFARLLAAHPDAVGYVFAVNGRINSGDEYGSNALFAKLWPKLLRASATEALADRTKAQAVPPVANPKPEAVQAFIDTARGAAPASRKVTAAVRLTTRETRKSLYAESRLSTGAWFHRGYIAK